MSQNMHKKTFEFQKIRSCTHKTAFVSSIWTNKKARQRRGTRGQLFPSSQIILYTNFISILTYINHVYDIGCVQFSIKIFTNSNFRLIIEFLQLNNVKISILKYWC